MRGAEGDFYLKTFDTGSEYFLDSLPAQILWHCDGNHSLEWLAQKFSQPAEDVESFLAEIEKAELLTMEQEKKPVTFPPFARPPYLKEVQFDATGHCNLFGICKHCYGKKVFQEAAKTELSLEEMLKIFKQMHDLNVANCFLSGGEIFTRRDLPEIIQAIAANQIYLSGIFTNGTIHRPEVISAVLASGVRTTFLVSLDGHTSSINDFMRGPGNLAKTVTFIKEAKGAGLKVTVNTMVIRQNIAQLMDMALFLEDLGIDRWRLSIPREQGEAILNKELIVPEWEQIFTAYEMLLRYGLTKKGGMRIQLSSIFKTEFLEKKNFFLFVDDTSCCEYKRWSLVVKPNGMVVACPALDSLVFGDLRRMELSEIWYSDLTQAFKTLPLSATECHDCPIKQYCGSGCRQTAFQLHGSILARDTNACPLYQFFYDRILPIFQEYGIEPQPLPVTQPYRFDPMILDKAIATGKE